MNILAPISKRSCLQPFAQAGADEFYTGFTDRAWKERFGSHADLNRMSGLNMNANPFSFEEVLEIGKEVESLGKKLYVTFNAHAYTVPQLDYLFGYFEQLKEEGVAGVIVSTPSAVQAAADCGLETVASTMCGVYNSTIASFYKELGCTRAIIPRDVGLGDIQAIIANEPDLDYEVFLMRNGCIFADGYCLGRHEQGCPTLCWDVRHVRRTFKIAAGGAVDEEAARRNNTLYGGLHQASCGLCALFWMQTIGVSATKVVGRSDDPAAILRDIELIAINRDIARHARSEREYLDTMIRPPGEEHLCAEGLNCYYPEVRF